MGNQRRKTVGEAGIAPVQLDKDANELIQVWCDERDTIKRGVLSKIVRWWVRQPESFQNATLRNVPPEMTAAYADVLETMAKRLRSGESAAFPDLKGDERFGIIRPDDETGPPSHPGQSTGSSDTQETPAHGPKASLSPAGRQPKR